MIGDGVEETNPRPAGNAGQFASFERRPGTNNYWNDDMLLEAVIIILNNIKTITADGQKYIVYFATYTRSIVMESLNFIYQNGDCNLNE